MSSELLLLVGTLLSVDGGSATLDKGLLEGLLPGDRGAIYYQLRVAGEPRRIEVGDAEVRDVDVSWSTIELGDAAARPGYLLEVRVPADRTRPKTLLESAQTHLNQQALEQVRRTLIDELPADLVGPPPAGDGSLARVEQPSPAPQSTIPRSMLLVPAGTYPIGRNPDETPFYNQQPRHTASLGAFRIDFDRSTRAGAGDPPPTWHEADAFCRSLNLRLPTEQEWETAQRMRQMEPGRGLEWTASRYLPYPGNTFVEDGYTGVHYVIRGSRDTQDSDPYHRRFASPETRGAGLGFRCAESVAE